MFHTRLHLPLFFLVAGLLVVTGLALVPGSSLATDGPGPAQDQEFLWCDPSWSREVDPRIIKEGDQVGVKVNYKFYCTAEVKKVNYMMVIENSGALRQGLGGREALENVQKGSQRFVNQVAYSNGSQAGLVLYATSRTIRVPLMGGEAARKEMLDAIGNISIEPIGNGVNLGAAIRDATQQLPTGVTTEFTNIMIIVDAGAMEVPDPLVDRLTACNAARQGGVTVAVLSFPNAQRRLSACANRGWFFQVRNDEGTDVPAIFDQIAEGLLRDKQMDKVIYTDEVRDGFKYVKNSGYPREPDFGGLEIGWEFIGKTAPPTGQRIEYNVVTEKGELPYGQGVEVSQAAHLVFSYIDQTDVTVNMPNPQVCVYRTDPRECDRFALTLTPPAPTETPIIGDTPTPTPTATDVPPSPTFELVTPTPTTVSPSETPATVETPTTQPPPGFHIFLPGAYRRYAR